MRKYLPVVSVLMLLTASVEAAAQSAPSTQTAPEASQIEGSPPGAIVGTAYRKPVQSAPPRKDIPAIAKAANGSIVSIVMSDKDGKPIAQGSGFLVSKDGLIVTNYHVISEGSSAIAKFPDGAFFVVDGVVAYDKTRDIAVIKAHGKNFRTLTLGNSDRIQVGEEVVAIGNPLSLESTVSSGIVSGIRTVKEEGGNFLQVTAPISPGSSGGPLFNMAGEVVGITTMNFKGGENLNFAIPVNDAKRLLSTQSTKLQGFPEAEPKDTKGTKDPANIYHIKSYNPTTSIVTVQHNNQVLTTIVYKAEVCDDSSFTSVEAILKAKDNCQPASSIAGQLVGKDAIDMDYIDSHLDVFLQMPDRFYEVELRGDFIHVHQAVGIRNQDEDAMKAVHFEVWNVKKIEEVNP